MVQLEIGNQSRLVRRNSVIDKKWDSFRYTPTLSPQWNIAQLRRKKGQSMSNKENNAWYLQSTSK